MNMKTAQIIMAFLFAFGAFLNLYYCVNPKPRKEPMGFTGVIATAFVYGCLLYLYIKAGAFSQLLP